MSEEHKQIEEMAKVLCKNALTEYCASGRCSNQNCLVNAKALETLYNAGYRKQSEGKWVANRHISVTKRNRTIHYETYKCSVCGTWNGRHRQNYCPNCGAKMKGGSK